MKLCSQGIFRTKSNIYDGAFFTSVKPYFKNVLKFHFLLNSPFRQKTYNSENARSKSLLLTIEHFFFKIQNYAMEWRHQ